MTVDQALLFAASLVDASRRAIQNGQDTIDVLTDLQAADDAAREELEAAMEEVEVMLGGRG